jgi:phosphate transport system substrate-binding protein
MTRYSGIFLIILLLTIICFSGCANTSPNGANKTSVPAQTITVSGAFALYPMMVKWAEEYHTLNPDVKIEVSAGGAGKGMTDALTGMADLGMVSREISQEEYSKGAVAAAVTKDAVVLTTNINNPVLSDLRNKGINKTLLKQIFIDGTEMNWSDVTNTQGVPGKVNVYTRSDACGAADVWAKYLGYKQEDLKGVGVFGDPGLAEAVKMDRLGLGYNNIGFAYDSKTGRPLEGLEIIPLDLNDNGQIDRNEQFYATREEITSAIDNGRYPSPPSRELYLVTKGNFSGSSQKFVHWILTDGQQYVMESGYIALPKERIGQEIRKLQ